MKILRTTEMLHPTLLGCVSRIQKEVVLKHSVPIKLFETGRTHERHSTLIQRGKTRDIVSRHLFNLENDPPLYTTAVDFVYFDDKWSWNLRDGSVMAWYTLFGNLVLDTCPELTWGGIDRKSINYCHFQLKESVVRANFDKFPCVVP